MSASKWGHSTSNSKNKFLTVHQRKEKNKEVTSSKSTKTSKIRREWKKRWKTPLIESKREMLMMILRWRRSNFSIGFYRKNNKLREERKKLRRLKEKSKEECRLKKRRRKFIRKRKNRRVMMYTDDLNIRLRVAWTNHLPALFSIVLKHTNTVMKG